MKSHGHLHKNWNEVNDCKKRECIPELRERLNLPFALEPVDEEPFYLWILVCAIKGNRVIQTRKQEAAWRAAGGPVEAARRGKSR